MSSIKQRRCLSITGALLLLCAATLLARPAWAAENKLLLQGIQDYNAGNYTDAVGHLGGALPTEGYNPILHYYLANSYVRLKQRDAAVREFRIGFALDPDGEVGNLSRQALIQLGADSMDGAQPPPPAQNPWATLGGMGKPGVGAFGEQLTPAKPMKGDSVNKALTSLQRQSQDAQAERTGYMQGLADALSKSGNDIIQRTQTQMQEDLSNGHRHRQPMPPESTRQLELMRQMYDNQKASYIKSGQDQAAEIRRSAENLQQLLNDPSMKGTHLSPNGTNLYIRNYEDERKKAAGGSQ